MKKLLTLSLLAAAGLAFAPGCTVETCDADPVTGYCPSVLTVQWDPAGNAGECPPNALASVSVLDEIGGVAGTIDDVDCTTGQIIFDIPAPGPHTVDVVIYDGTYPTEMTYGTYNASFILEEDASYLEAGAMNYAFGFANAEWSVNGGTASTDCPAASAVELLVTLDTTADLVIFNQDCAVGGLSQTLPLDDGGGHGGALDLVDTVSTDSYLANPVADTILLDANQADYAYYDGVVDFTTL